MDLRFETIERFGVAPHRAANTIQFMSELMSEPVSGCPNQTAYVRTNRLCPSQSAYVRIMLCVAQRMILLEFGMARFCVVFALSRHVVYPRSFYLSGLPSVEAGPSWRGSTGPAGAGGGFFLTVW